MKLGKPVAVGFAEEAAEAADPAASVPSPEEVRPVRAEGAGAAGPRAAEDEAVPATR